MRGNGGKEKHFWQVGRVRSPLPFIVESAVKGHIQHSSDNKLKEKNLFQQQFVSKANYERANCHLLLCANQYSTVKALVLSEFATWFMSPSPVITYGLCCNLPPCLHFCLSLACCFLPPESIPPWVSCTWLACIWSRTVSWIFQSSTRALAPK